MTKLLTHAVAPVRLPVELMTALPAVLSELPATVRGLRAALAGLARLTAVDGELTVLLREAARLAARRAQEEEAAAARRQRPRARGASRAGNAGDGS